MTAPEFNGIWLRSAVVVELSAPLMIVMPPGNAVPSCELPTYIVFVVSLTPIQNGKVPAGTFAITEWVEPSMTETNPGSASLVPLTVASTFVT